MRLLVRRAMKPVPGPISCLRLPGTLQHVQRLGLRHVIHAPYTYFAEEIPPRGSGFDIFDEWYYNEVWRQSVAEEI